MFSTILSGVLVFVISQFFLRLVLEPIVEYKRTIAKIDNSLKFYSNIIVNPSFPSTDLPSDYVEAKSVLRKLSSELESNYKIIPFNRLLVFIKLLLPKRNIDKAATALIWISNVVGNNDETGTANVPFLADEKINQILQLLDLN